MGLLLLLFLFTLTAFCHLRQHIYYLRLFFEKYKNRLGFPKEVNRTVPMFPRLQPSGWITPLLMPSILRFPLIDEWLRRRIRMCCLEAVVPYTYQSAQSSPIRYFQKTGRYDITQPQGPWHLSGTMAAQSGMTDKWLSEQGLISVKEQWVKIHYPATAR